ncbi:MAG: hypothetical protein NC452_04035 [Eubacterium sp.]|nr:hypothetical protein [Eubacterium sp.]
MKKGIEAYADFDINGRWVLKITKKKGKLTLDEIKDVCREWEQDFYLLFMDCYNDDEVQFNEDIKGDCVEVYQASILQRRP